MIMKWVQTIFKSESLSAAPARFFADVLVNIITRRIAADDTVQEDSAQVHQRKSGLRENIMQAFAKQAFADVTNSKEIK